MAYRRKLVNIEGVESFFASKRFLVYFFFLLLRRLKFERNFSY